MADNTDRFLAPPPVVIPKGASKAERLLLRFPRIGPPKGSPERGPWEAAMQNRARGQNRIAKRAARRGH